MTGEGGEVNVKEDLEGVKRAEAVWGGGRIRPSAGCCRDRRIGR